MSSHGVPPNALLRVSPADRLSAAVLGAACHAAFAVSILAMVVSLHQGLRFGAGRLVGGRAWAANLALTLSFPALHSWLLTPRGARVLDLVSTRRGRELRATTYALVAALQLLAVFALWSPLGGELWRARDAALVATNLAFAASWLLLLKAMSDAGLGVQTGWLGWSSVVRGRAPAYPRFAPRGLFRFTRQPIYLAFALTLWTAPVLNADRLMLAVAWTLYCAIGPLHKERRLIARDPDGYCRYRSIVPYWLPRFRPQRLET
jgi:protein-S-isoprenylcysteine O-methyltransferase Ste14